MRVARDEIRDLEAEVGRLREGLLACARAAGEDVSGGIPGWPDIVDWAVAAVREGRETYEHEAQAAEAEADRLRQTEEGTIGTVLGVLANIRDEAQDNSATAGEAFAYIIEQAQSGIAALQQNHKPEEGTG